MKIDYILIQDNSIEEKASKLAKKLDVPCVDVTEKYDETALHLEWSADGLLLARETLTMKGDYKKMVPRLKTNNLNGEFMVKAARIKGATQGLSLIDATAGMGEDSLLLAAAGFNVDLYEYDPVIAALLRDTLERASQETELSDIISRMTLHEEDSIEALKKLSYTPDVILLDPMFPERQKSASVKKKFQLLQQLECPCSEEAELINAALNVRPHKVIVKRPLKGPFLAGIKPDYSISGKAIRVDVFNIAGN